MYPYPIFGFIHLYGVMWAVGIILCFILERICAKKLNLSKQFVDFIELNAIIAIVVGILSAMLFQAIYDFIETGVFAISGSMTFIGGLIGGVISFILGFFIMRKKLDSKFYPILLFAPICITIAHSMGRIGCLFAGCCHGKLTDSWLGMTFTEIYNDGTYAGSFKAYPTQLYEAIFLLILCIVCFYLFYKKNFKYNFVIYLISYGIFRFFIEFLRGDHRGEFIGIISPSQFWSIIMILLSVPVYFLIKHLSLDYNNTPTDIKNGDL